MVAFLHLPQNIASKKVKTCPKDGMTQLYPFLVGTALRRLRALGSDEGLALRATEGAVVQGFVEGLRAAVLVVDEATVDALESGVTLVDVAVFLDEWEPTILELAAFCRVDT